MFKTNKQVVLFIIFFVFFILVAFRDFSVGIDTRGVYLSHFFYSDYRNISQIFSEGESQFMMEKGYLLIEYIVQSLIGKTYDGYRALIVLMGLLTISSYFYALKRSTVNEYLSAFFFVSFGFLSFSMTGIRQGLAIALCSWGVSFYLEKKHYFFYLFLLIAFFFHKSCLILLLLPLVSKININRKKELWLFIFSILIIPISAVIMRMVMNNYINFRDYSDFELRGVNFSFTAILFYSLIVSDMIINKVNTYRMNILRWSLILQGFIASMMFVNDLVFRLNYYFLIVTCCIYIPYMIKTYKSTILHFYYYIIAFTYFFYYEIWKNSCGIFPYKCIIFDN